MPSPVPNGKRKRKPRRANGATGGGCLIFLAVPLLGLLALLFLNSCCVDSNENHKKPPHKREIKKDCLFVVKTSYKNPIRTRIDTFRYDCEAILRPCNQVGCEGSWFLDAVNKPAMLRGAYKRIVTDGLKVCSGATGAEVVKKIER